MPSFALLTRLTPETVGQPRDLKTLEKAVAERIRQECRRRAEPAGITSR